MDEQLNVNNHESKKQEIIIGIAIVLSSLALIYFGISIYFINHFYFGTEINGVSASGKTVQTMSQQVESNLQSYTLSLKERGGGTEKITGAEIGLKFTPDEAVDNILNSQNPFKWVSLLFNNKGSRFTIEISYDEGLLKQKVNGLSCLNRNNVVDPKAPSFKYNGGGYTIVDGNAGNKVDSDALIRNMKDAVLKRQAELDLEAANCYVKPQYTSSSPKTIEVKDMLDRYVSSKITYAFGDAGEVLDGSVINKWLSVDDALNVIFDKEKVNEYVTALSNNYSKPTGGMNFVTTSGKAIKINGGTYSWKIDSAKETEYLISVIKEGKTATRKFSYTETTYVEIDLTDQHLWFYKGGKLITQGDIVSGNISKGLATPEGVYKLEYKKRGAILTGPGYSTRVEYWMPFFNGMGIHDATWRRAFGGNIYKTDGSHGCVNCPYNLAKKIYENIEAGTPIICYYF